MANQDNRSKAAADPSAGQDLRQKAEALAREWAARKPNKEDNHDNPH